MCRLLLMTIACLLVLFGISGLWMMPRLVQQRIEQRLQLKIGTQTFDRFTKVPIPLTVKFHLFNVTNGERVLQGLERPQFREVGPFMFKQWRRREIVDFEDYNRRLRYREIKTFIPMFNSSSSSATTNTSSTNPADTPLDPYSLNITMINLPLLSALTKLAQLEEGSLKRKMASLALERLVREGGDKILVNRPANQLLFDGYKVSFMESARDLLSNVLGFNFESPLPRNMFGFFFNKNDTWSRRESGELTVFTGRNGSMDQFMLIDNWNDQRQLSVWPSNTRAGNRCNEIRGTDGSQFHPGVDRKQDLEIFSPMICSSLRVRYREDTETRGIPLLRFATPPDLFGAPAKSQRNACYCTAGVTGTGSGSTATNGRASTWRNSSRESRCYLDGLLDLSLCQRGAPVAASSPHFYQGDPMLAQAAGLRPEKLRHETYLDVEPMTGAVMRACSRAQLNAYVEEAALGVLDGSVVGKMEPMVAPLVWLEEAAEIDEPSAAKFKAQLLHVVQRSRRSFFWAMGLGLVLGLVVGLQYWWVTCREPKSLSASASAGRLRRRNLAGAADAQTSNLLARQKGALEASRVSDEEGREQDELVAHEEEPEVAAAGPSSDLRAPKEAHF